VEKIKIDKKDKKIISLLTQNSRFSVSQIARKSGLPRDSVHYRIQRLIKQKIISSFTSIVDHLKLNHPIYNFVYFNLYALSENLDKEFFSYLSSHPKIVSVYQTIGHWDCLCVICAKDLEDFSERVCGWVM